MQDAKNRQLLTDLNRPTVNSAEAPTPRSANFAVGRLELQRSAVTILHQGTYGREVCKSDRLETPYCARRHNGMTMCTDRPVDRQS